MREATVVRVAHYDTPELGRPEGEDLAVWKPYWVPIDFHVEYIELEVWDRPGAQPHPGNAGWYMRPLGPAGGPYAIQARSGYNNGRATVSVSIAGDGAITVH